jgi:hypothetical protein
MATPDFLPQNDSNFTAIRYYTASDPYFYTIDNRPLQDIETNLKADRTGGSDAARRAALLGALNLAALASDTYGIPTSISSAVRSMAGLGISTPSTNVIRVAPGVVYEARAVSTSITDVIMKQALITKTTDFTFTPPVTAGTSIVYTIEGTFNELTTSNISTSTLPNLDSANLYLPSTLTHGELVLSTVAGTAATTGTEVPASTTSGKFPLFNITYIQGTTNPVVALHASAPYLKGIYQHVTPIALTSGGATIGVTNEIPSATFADAATSGVILQLAGSALTTNPFKAIRVKMTFASTASSGNFVVRLRHKGFAVGDLTSATTITTSNETITVTGAANAIQTNITATAIVPNTQFAGFVGGVWTLNKEKLNVILERIGADASDTNTGSLVLINTFLVQ